MRRLIFAALALLAACTVFRLKLPSGAECSGVIMLNGSVQCCEDGTGQFVYSSAMGAFTGTCLSAKAGPLSMAGGAAIGGAFGAAAAIIPLAL